MNYKIGSQVALIQTLPESHNLYMCMNTTNKGARGWITLSKEDALKKLTKNNGMYEVIIHNKPRQVYFDCDFKGIDYIENFKALLILLMPDANLNISGSKQEFKNSYHIVIDNYYFQNIDLQKCIINFIKTSKIKGFTLEEIGVDSAVYDRNRNFKCINQSKVDRVGNKAVMSPFIQEFISGSKLNEDHLVCLFKDRSTQKDAYDIFKYFETNKPSKTVPKSKTPFELMTITQSINNEKIFDIDHDDICDLFLNDKCKDHWDHMTSLNICNYYIQMGRSFEDFWKLRKFKRDTSADFIKWQSRWKYQLTKEELSIDRQLQLKRILVSSLGGVYTNIGLEYYTRIYRDSLDVQSTRDIKRIELLESDLDSENKVIILANNMGAGKTKVVLEHSKKYESCCIITCRTSLQKNIQSRTDDFISYNDLATLSKISVPKTTQKLAKNNIHLVKKIIITPNSIHYINDTVYDLVVIDEVEVFLNIWSMKDKITKDSVMIGPKKDGILTNQFVNNYYKIIRILKNSKRIIFMDALISYRSFRYLIRAKVIESEQEVEVITSSVNREAVCVKHLYVEATKAGEICETLSTEKGIETLIESINNKERNYIFWPYVNPSGLTNKKLTRLSQRELINLLEDKIGRKLDYFMYNADESKESLLDVNKNWKDVDFIIVNQSVTVGVSYDNMEFLFDNVFIFDAPFVSIREIVQTSKRCRQLSEGGCVYYIDLGGMNTNNYVFSREQIDHPLIKNTVIDTQNELIAKKDFSNVYYTFIKAGFKFEGVKSKRSDITYNVLDYKDTNYLFENIYVNCNDLYRDEVEEQETIFNLSQKLCFLKKKFCRYFKDYPIEEALENQMIGSLWNMDKDFCFTLLALGELDKLGTDYVFKSFPMELINLIHNEIINCIGLDEDVIELNIKLVPEVKIRLIKELRQETLSTQTNDMVMLTKYLSTFFRKSIISSERKKGCHVSYSVSVECWKFIIILNDLLTVRQKCMFVD